MRLTRPSAGLALLAFLAAGAPAHGRSSTTHRARDRPDLARDAAACVADFAGGQAGFQQEAPRGLAAYAPEPPADLRWRAVAARAVDASRADEDAETARCVDVALAGRGAADAQERLADRLLQALASGDLRLLEQALRSLAEARAPAFGRTLLGFTAVDWRAPSADALHPSIAQVAAYGLARLLGDAVASPEAIDPRDIAATAERWRAASAPR